MQSSELIIQIYPKCGIPGDAHIHGAPSLPCNRVALLTAVCNLLWVRSRHSCLYVYASAILQIGKQSLEILLENRRSPCAFVCAVDLNQDEAHHIWNIGIVQNGFVNGADQTAHCG